MKRDKLDDLMPEIMKLQKLKNRSEAQEKKLQEMMSKLAQENPALIAEIIQKWLREDTK